MICDSGHNIITSKYNLGRTGCVGCNEARVPNMVAREHLKQYTNYDTAFIKQRLEEVHGTKYTPVNTLCDMVARNKIKMLCGICATIFDKEIRKLLGCGVTVEGCPRCADNAKKNDAVEIIARIQHTHGNSLNLNKFIYENMNSLCEVQCNACGLEYLRTPSILIVGGRCPSCIGSLGSRRVARWLSNNYLDFRQEMVMPGTQLRFDYYVEEYDWYIEFDGSQHFQSVEFFGGANEFTRLTGADIMKNNYCMGRFPLLRISYKQLNTIELYLMNSWN